MNIYYNVTFVDGKVTGNYVLVKLQNPPITILIQD